MVIKVNELIDSLTNSINQLEVKCVTHEVGSVVSVADGIIQAVGIDQVATGELVKFESNSLGIVMNLEQNSTSIVLLSKNSVVKQGEKVFRTKQCAKVKVGKELLGRVLDGLGNPIDDKGDIDSFEKRNIESDAPCIIARQSVCQPLYTGIKFIDSLIPIGKGQRELIIGDRQIGKTAIAIDTIINQKRTHSTKEPVYCVYVAIGQKCSNIAYIAKKLEQCGALHYTTIVSTTASDSAVLQYLAPYVGCTIGEYFRDNGMHALVIYDDLSKHAQAYRQISLLLKRPPGREAYPGDIFFVHSKLLERAGKLSDDLGSGSLTALPIVETQAGDISAYIPTNIISITDGQIFLEEELFYKGIRPAVNVGLSVSRVGSAAQVKAMKKVSGKLRLDLAQYRELESFTSFASDLNEETKNSLNYGRKIIESMKQEQYKPVSMAEQVIILYSQINNHIKNIDVSLLSKFYASLITHIENEYKHIIQDIEQKEDITTETKMLLDDVIIKFLAKFSQNT